MLNKSLPVPLLLCLATLFFSTTTAAPLTRAHCRCSRLSPANDNPLFSSTSNSFLSAKPSGPCNSLARSLEALRHHDLPAFDSIFAAQETPMPSIPLDLSSETSPYSKLGYVLPAESLDPTPVPLDRIVCMAEKDTSYDFESSKTTLFVLQVIVGLAFLACAAELVSLVIDFLTTKRSKPVQLAGEEKLLTADIQPSTDQLFSPGVEKKLNAYSIQQAQKKTEDGDDDELNWPVL